jgi:hypothetical protein
MVVDAGTRHPRFQNGAVLAHGNEMAVAHAYSTDSAVIEANASGVSWSAVFAGAAVIAALALLLLALGVGFGLSAISPWSSDRSELTVGSIAIVWMIVVQVLASSMGGYVAGRLRTKWTRIHGDEVHFRDTAHGFLAWSVASVVTAAFLASAVSTMAGRPARATANGTAASGVAGSASMENAADAYYVDALFRSAASAPTSNAAADGTRAEASRLFGALVASTDSATGDREYLTTLVSTRAGVDATEAQRRVDAEVTLAKVRLDVARRTAARASLWAFLALLIGAFCASWAATVGGRQRDRVVTV